MPRPLVRNGQWGNRPDGREWLFGRKARLWCQRRRDHAARGIADEKAAIQIGNAQVTLDRLAHVDQALAQYARQQAARQRWRHPLTSERSHRGPRGHRCPRNDRK